MLGDGVDENREAADERGFETGGVPFGGSRDRPLTVDIQWFPTDLPVEDFGVARVCCPGKIDNSRCRPRGDFIEILFEISVAVVVKVSVIIGNVRIQTMLNLPRVRHAIAVSVPSGRTVERGSQRARIGS